MSKHSSNFSTGIRHDSHHSTIYGTDARDAIDPVVDAIVEQVQTNQDGLAGIGADLTSHGDRADDAVTTKLIENERDHNDPGSKE